MLAQRKTSQQNVMGYKKIARKGRKKRIKKKENLHTEVNF